MKTYSIIISLFIGVISVLGCGSDKEYPAYSMVEVATEEVTSIEVVEEEEVEVEVVEEEEVEVEVTTTAELISTPEFSLTSATVLQVNLPISPSAKISYFINICTNFSSENDEVIIQYDSCKLRAMLNTTEQQYALSLSAAEKQLIAQIWPIVNDAKPINIYWNITELGNNWQIVL